MDDLRIVHVIGSAGVDACFEGASDTRHPLHGAFDRDQACIPELGCPKRWATSSVGSHSGRELEHQCLPLPADPPGAHGPASVCGRRPRPPMAKVVSICSRLEEATRDHSSASEGFLASVPGAPGSAVPSCPALCARSGRAWGSRWFPMASRSTVQHCRMRPGRATAGS